MPITPQWDNAEKTVIKIIYQGRWTWDEFQAAVKATNALMDAVDYPLVLMHDTLQSAPLPAGNILAQGQMAIAGFSNNVALIIVIANSGVIRTFVNIAAGLNPGGRGSIIKTASSLEEAQRLIEKTAI